VRNRWAPVVAGLVAFLCLPCAAPAQTAAAPAALPDETADVPQAPDGGVGGNGSAPAGDEGFDLATFFTERVRVRAHVLHGGYKDLQIMSRRIKQNDLGLGFAQSTVKAQNDAEEKSWTETTESVELLVDPLGEGEKTIWLFVGAGSRQAHYDFGTGSVDLKEAPVGVFSAGVMGNLGELAPGIRLDWEFRFSYAGSNKMSVDEIPAVSEELETTAMTYAARLVVVFDPALMAPCTELDGARLQPYAGLYYRHLELEETYTASSSSGVVGESKFEFKTQSDPASDFQFVGGVRLLGLDDHATVDLEGSVGYQSYGAGFIINFRF
jgi:hypothetical protein